MSINMTDLIVSALDTAYIKLDKITPATKTEIKSVSLPDISPLDIPSFMKDNDIPDTAYFDGTDNGYDGWVVGDIKLSWDVEVPTLEEDKLNFRKSRFSGLAFKFVYDILTKNGYIRVGFNSGELKKFDDTTVYDMYLDGDYDKLVKYYSLAFKKN